MKKNSSNKVSILLTIVIVCLILGGCFVVYSLLKDNLNKNNISDNQMSGVKQDVYYDLNNINNVKVWVPKANADGPDMEIKEITNKEEIKSILINIDSAVFVKKIKLSDGVGNVDDTAITINYNDDPSTEIIILDNGNIAMNLAVGAGESGYAEYSINNKKLEEELINKYQTKILE